MTIQAGATGTKTPGGIVPRVETGVVMTPARAERVVGDEVGQSGVQLLGHWEDFSRNPGVVRSGQILIISWRQNYEGLLRGWMREESRLTPQFWRKQLEG